ncbi:hypothetical protein L1987_16613 [Smallanthus sonchifolius]|uniref:Uncharacterized protein n=1 Tax=Smallanthus sonchifolius TaxID=185202 RepID=A0ACB9IY27_9ASTR|nr:hypothetical protein L1987_16613 [Smallanthus sonchifolius]
MGTINCNALRIMDMGIHCCDYALMDAASMAYNNFVIIQDDRLHGFAVKRGSEMNPIAIMMLEFAEDMSAFGHNKEEEEEPKKSKNVVKSPATLASIESLTFPLVQEVVILADYRCKICQDRVADIISKLDGDMEMMIMEKKVILSFAGRYSKPIKSTIYKNIVNKISNVLCYANAS